MSCFVSCRFSSLYSSFFQRTGTRSKYASMYLLVVRWQVNLNDCRSLHRATGIIVLKLLPAQRHEEQVCIAVVVVQELRLGQTSLSLTAKFLATRKSWSRTVQRRMLVGMFHHGNKKAKGRALRRRADSLQMLPIVRDLFSTYFVTRASSLLVQL